MHARQGHDDNPRATLFTHVCMKCNTLLNLGYDQKKGAWVTTRALAHFKNSPECDLSLSDKVKAGNTNRHNQLVLNMLGAGASNSASQALVTAGLVLDPVSRALTKAARFYIYSPQRISKTTFTDPYFKDMINAYYKLGGGQGEAPVLTVKAIKKYVDAEFECFQIYSKYLMDAMLEFTEGNAPAQTLHDAATLANHHKKLAVADVMVDPKNFRVWCICLGMQNVKSSSGEDIKANIDLAHMRAYGRKTEEVSHSIMSDRAATHVAALYAQDPKACAMHDVDKVSVQFNAHARAHHRCRMPSVAMVAQ